MTSRAPLAAALAGALLLAGCTTTPTGNDTASPPASTPAAATPSTPPTSATPSPTSTLTAAQQEAVDQATDVVMAYEQTITDLYSGARDRINDLDNYATGDILDSTRRNAAQGRAQGWRSETEGAQLVLVSAEPVSVKLKADPPTVVLWACIDSTADTRIGADGQRNPGLREEYQYRVVKTSYLPAPGWAVAEIKAAKDPKDRAC